MGSFYRVRLGPFASQAETGAACARLKSTGLDCLVVMQ
jgi:cell division protein FtsN